MKKLDDNPTIHMEIAFSLSKTCYMYAHLCLDVSSYKDARTVYNRITTFHKGEFVYDTT